MAFYSGTATSFADLQTVLENACVANDWVLNSGILSKNGCFFKLTNTASQLQLDGGTGQTTTTLDGSPTFGVKIASITGYAMTFPINYDLHVFNNPDEVYLIVNYNSGYYQQLSFGKSDIPGIGGTGLWMTGSIRSNLSVTDSATATMKFSIYTSNLGTSITSIGMAGGMFYDAPYSPYSTTLVHCGLDVLGWKISGSSAATTGLLCTSIVSGILSALPNLTNNANVLLPIRAAQYRNSGGLTIVANLQNARFLRIDNINPGEIITFGSENWKVYPLYKKDTGQRDGGSSAVAHSGTLGYAIRYTGV